MNQMQPNKETYTNTITNIRKVPKITLRYQ